MTIILLVTFIVILIIFLIVKISYKIYLKTVFLFYGKYSPQYVLAYKRIHDRNIPQRKIKDKRVLQNSVSPRTPFPEAVIDDVISHFLALKDCFTAKVVYSTSRNINFNKIHFGMSLDGVISKMGKPHFFTVQEFNEDKLIAIRYQRGNNENHHSKIFYFINNVFVYGELVYSCMDEKYTDSFKQLFVSHFNINCYANTEFIFCVKDSGNNLIAYDFSGSRIVLRYGNLSNPILATIIETAIPSTQEDYLGQLIDLEVIVL